MKIQCDVCSVGEALVFCCTDEAALCDACDRHVHHANKLAGKHRRFSLLKPSPSPSPTHPLCDVCQERRGILFCQEDRAILCRDCDVPIHNANQHTMKHSRFILTGVRLSAAPIPSSSEAEVVLNISNNNHHSRNRYSKINQEKVVALEEEEIVCTTRSNTTTTTTNSNSSISEYLIKMLPGWHVEDFLFDDSATPNSSYQADELLPFRESSSSGICAAAAEGSPILDHGASHQNHSGGEASRQRLSKHVLMVPQFHNYLSSKKRPRNSLWQL